ncbi:hypothetical protein J2S06_002870 [Bacillus alveayuensis]|jgi:hypothetical protein|uniref:Uncharacterized protein n=1 Tax=Aeribacillus alveayuensis TaxID=279215 RepID=A0ABT9VSB7_9BACI|nr:hypothetical protein [Bacillus alveayuensis]
MCIELKIKEDIFGCCEKIKTKHLLLVLLMIPWTANRVIVQLTENV